MIKILVSWLGNNCRVDLRAFHVKYIPDSLKSSLMLFANLLKYGAMK